MSGKMPENFKKNVLEKAGKGSNTGFLRFYTLRILLENKAPLSVRDIKNELMNMQQIVHHKSIARILKEIEALHPIMQLQCTIKRPIAAHRKPTEYYSLIFNS